MTTKTVLKIFGAAVVAAVVLVPARAGSSETPDSDLAAWKAADAQTQSAVLGLAREAFDAYAERREVISPPDGLPPLLSCRAALFVSAQVNGAPRCCMGSLYPLDADAAHQIIDTAGAAAGRDLRFPPVRPSELSGLRIIVSIVGPPRSITDQQAQELDPVTEGLVVECDGRRGVVLSGETRLVGRMILWARIRSGASQSDAVRYFQIDDVRFIEPARPAHSEGQPS